LNLHFLHHPHHLPHRNLLHDRTDHPNPGYRLNPVALFSENLQQLKELEDRYRQELDDYQRDLSRYQTLLEHNPNDAELPALYERVESTNRKVQETYAKLERLRRSLYPTAGASSTLA
jgi:predicted RNase H-like nuclease (RuvC/YqgF family)